MYERPINPPEPILADLTVNVEGNSRGTLDQIMRTLGGEAAWTSDRPIEDDWREFRASTIVEDCEDYSTAEDIVHNLILDHLSDTVDIENLVIDAPVIEDDVEIDYDLWKYEGW